MLAVVVAGLAVAFWLPTRNDSASATENGFGGSWSQYRDWRHYWGGQGGGQQNRTPQFPSGGWGSGGWGSPFPTWSPSASPTPSESATPSESPSESPSATPSESPSESPSATPTSAAPTSEAPTKTKWAEFTDYSAGQIVTYKGKDYEVLEDHTSLPGWEPPALPALFKLLS